MSKHHLLSPLFQISKLSQPRKLVIFLLGNYLTFSIHLTTFMNMENVIWPLCPNENFGTLQIQNQITPVGRY